MKRNKVKLFGILFVILCSVQCRPVKKSITSSYWRYTDDDLSYELLFKPDGHLYSYHPGDASPENDFWKQRGRRVTLTMNDSYAVYKGKLINDSTMTGTGRSKGFRWKWGAKFVTNN